MIIINAVKTAKSLKQTYDDPLNSGSIFSVCFSRSKVMVNISDEHCTNTREFGNWLFGKFPMGPK